jgi:hypothetical protein
MPANYTKKRRIGSIKTDASAHIYGFSQLGDEFVWTSQPASWDVSNAGTIGSAQLVIVNVPAAVSNIAVINAGFVVGGYITIQSVQGYGATSNWNLANNAASQISGGQFRVRTNTAQQIQIMSAAAYANGLFLAAVGWVDTRGK